MENKEEKYKCRPCWKVDVKWIVALIFIPVFFLSLIIINLYLLTGRNNAIKASSTILEALFSPTNENIEESIVKVREKIQESPDKVFRPFPGTDVKITEDDLNKYPPSELKQKLFTELAENIYDGKSAEIQGMTFKESFSKLGVMALLTLKGHQFIGGYLIYAILASVILLALLVYFSYGFGRLLSPGLIFLIVGLPSLLLMTIIQKQPEGGEAVPQGGELSPQQMIGFFAGRIGPIISGVFSKTYIFIVLLGVLLILAGVIGRIIQKVRSKTS